MCGTMRRSYTNKPLSSVSRELYFPVPTQHLSSPTFVQPLPCKDIYIINLVLHQFQQINFTDELMFT